MKVVCKINNLKNINDEGVLARLKKYISMQDGDVDLEIEREYIVYGIVFWDNSPWYYLCIEDYDQYPKPFPSEFFDVTDGRLSSYWVLHVENEEEILSSIVFREWANTACFYELLLEGDEFAIENFNNYRELIDIEAEK